MTVTKKKKYKVEVIEYVEEGAPEEDGCQYTYLDSKGNAVRTTGKLPEAQKPAAKRAKPAKAAKPAKPGKGHAGNGRAAGNGKAAVAEDPKTAKLREEAGEGATIKLPKEELDGVFEAAAADRFAESGEAFGDDTAVGADEVADVPDLDIDDVGDLDEFEAGTAVKAHPGGAELSDLDDVDDLTDIQDRTSEKKPRASRTGKLAPRTGKLAGRTGKLGTGTGKIDRTRTGKGTGEDGAAAPAPEKPKVVKSKRYKVIMIVCIVISVLCVIAFPVVKILQDQAFEEAQRRANENAENQPEPDEIAELVQTASEECGNGVGMKNKLATTFDEWRRADDDTINPDLSPSEQADAKARADKLIEDMKLQFVTALKYCYSGLMKWNMAVVKQHEELPDAPSLRTAYRSQVNQNIQKAYGAINAIFNLALPSVVKEMNDDGEVVEARRLWRDWQAKADEIGEGDSLTPDADDDEF